MVENLTKYDRNAQRNGWKFHGYSIRIECVVGHDMSVLFLDHLVRHVMQCVCDTELLKFP